MIDLTRDFLSTAATLIVGSIALYLYGKQKFDEKRNAANIIYLELISASRVLKRAKEDLGKKGIPSEYALAYPSMPSESWSKNKYLFVRNFEPKEWDSIEDFYKKCQLFDQAVEHNNSLFIKNEQEIRINLAKYLAEYLSKNKVDMTKFNPTTFQFNDPITRRKWQSIVDGVTNFQSMLINSSTLFIYKPQKPINDANLQLDNLDLDISESSIGNKLIKISRSHFIFSMIPFVNRLNI